MCPCDAERCENLRRVVRRCYEIERRRTILLEREKAGGKFRRRHLCAAALVTDRVILTVDAAQRAVREEHCARTVCADKARLLPRVQHRACNAYRTTCTAESACARIPIHAAATRAERAVIEQILHSIPPFHIFSHKNRDGKPSLFCIQTIRCAATAVRYPHRALPPPRGCPKVVPCPSRALRAH